MITSERPPLRQVRAVFDQTTLTVYQAYSPQVADVALAAGTFVPPFKTDRMTWIKPSFLWMMYRSGWATKPDQERILAIRISRIGFEQAPSTACLSHDSPALRITHEDWLQRKQTSPVRVQWDPERSLRLEPLPWRTIQIGLGGPAAHQYVSEWITGIDDVTQAAHDLHRLLDRDDPTTAQHHLPVEKPYPLPPAAARAVGATQLT